jgi:hypothetical protein
VLAHPHPAAGSTSERADSTTVGRYPLSLPHNRANTHPQKIAGC